MAIATAKITGCPDTTYGNEKVRTRRLTFSGNYATGGETVTPKTVFGLSKINRLIIHGSVAAASALTTGVPLFYDQANGKMVFFEGSAAGTALSEKTNAEAYPTGCFVDVTAIGTTSATG